MGSNAIDVLMGGGRLDKGSDEGSDHSFEQDELSTGGLPIASYSPIFVSQHTSPVPSRRKPTSFQKLSIVVPPRNSDDEYEDYDEPVVIYAVVDESIRGGNRRYQVEFNSGESLWISQEHLTDLRGGTKALDQFKRRSLSHSRSYGSSTDDSNDIMVTTRQNKATRKRYGDYVNSSTLHLSSDDELNAPQAHSGRNRPKRRLPTAPRETRRTQVRFSQLSLPSDDDSSSGPSRRRSKRGRDVTAVNYIDTLQDDDSGDGSDARPRRKRRFQSPPRRSERSRRVTNMQEVGEDDELPERPTDKPFVKIVGARETFQPRLKSDEFRLRHLQSCDTCGDTGDHEVKGHLIFCQGCSISYHLQCLGHRASRDHLVTKVGHRDFVLQCRRCIESARTRDSTAPRQGRCQGCKQDGPSCRPFRERKTMLQEQKEREENEDEDPSVAVPVHLLNNPKNVLFRCVGCYRAYHYHHLPSRSELTIVNDGGDSDEEAEKRIGEYCKDWICDQCADAPAKIEGLVAWRPTDPETYAVGTSTEQMDEDDKEYLVKWQDLSYHQSSWQSGAWIWGNTAPQMRKAFARRDNGTNLPKMTYEDAIPEDWLRVDIIFDVKYTSVVKTRVLEIDLARVNEVGKALVKYKGLSYEDTVWEAPPDITDTERWEDFKTAYDDWVHARYIRPPNSYNLKKHLTSLRQMNFANKVELKQQPEALSGGELMEYQMEGLNWLLFQWYQEKNAILADEMGLGKTIQVIGFLAALQSKHRCWPFLIVVPDATCANWRREIKQWAPGLRVVMFFGSSKARELSQKHELFPEGAKELRCHVVVTSYNTAQDDANQRIFRRVQWAGLVVDEGQRLKNEHSLLYAALNSLKIPFRLLLTGTPLQNNQRELFNLLQFLDHSINAAELEEKYAELNKENLPELHQLIRPYFLRRTKAQVLTFLPPMAQIIVPVSLSPLQKELYKSVLAKNADLLQVIFGTDKRTFQKVTGLKNLLMQLRKCLCHPFVYSIDIEEKSSNEAISHKGLVEASSKLRLLEIMLPKLQERGHRVLVFSQFLDMLTIIEDFLDGLGLAHLRIDGSMSSLQKQKKIDEYNAPDSQIFACLLSTRAGGVGINLATADTVIILDPDFNPHQDIQALSRAHRIGQKNKVLVFQLMTRNTAEEKIMQLGKKKMALDHVLIEQLDAEQPDGNDLESVLKFGAEALFKEDDQSHDIVYDSASVDRLLDRTQAENTKAGTDKTAESQFSFARVWTNDAANMENGLEDHQDEEQADPTVWDKILAERARLVELDKASRAEALGRGKRQRRNLVDLSTENMDDLGSPLKKGQRKSAESEDEEFEDAPAESEGEEEESAVEDDAAIAGLGDELKDTAAKAPSRSRYMFKPPEPKAFHRAVIRSTSHVMPAPSAQDPPCFTCSNVFGAHRVGWCPLKIAGVEYCPICRLPHYGIHRTCPHLQDELAVRKLLKQLRESPESDALKAVAAKHLRGIVGNLVQKQKFARLAEQNPANGTARDVPPEAGYASYQTPFYPQPYHPPKAPLDSNTPLYLMAGGTTTIRGADMGGSRFPPNPPGYITYRPRVAEP